MLQAGAIGVVITPPIGVELAGYGPRIGRYSQDIHDELTAQALVLDDGTTRCAIVTSDLISISTELTAQVRQDVAQRTQIPADHVMIACSHSHTSPTTHPFNDWGGPDAEYVLMVGRIMAGAIVAAEGRLQPATLSVAQSSYDQLAWNRTGRDLLDTTVEVVQLADAAGAPIALLVHYACHPVMLGPQSLICADFPGAMRRALAADFPTAVSMFANGACGDIDPLTNKRAWGSASLEEVEQAGAGLAAAALQALAQAETVDNPQISVRTASLDLPFNVPSLETVRERIATYTAEADALGDQPEDFKEVTGEVRMPRFWLRYYTDLEAKMSAGTQADSMAAELQAFKIGDALTLVAIPAEVYTEQGMAIRRLSQAPHTLAVCYANGTYGYLPPRADYESGSYTAVLAAAAYGVPPYQPDIADRLVAAVDHLLA
jgi:hypothetical protein